MCFAPQRRALFRHLNFQKWSENDVFCTFWLRNVLRATTACNFSSLICSAASAPAALASLFSTRRSHKSLKKNMFHDFPTFSRTWIFFLLRFSLSSSLLFSDSSHLCDSFHLCFSSVHIVGSLTSKLPSIISSYISNYIIIWMVYMSSWIIIIFPLKIPIGWGFSPLTGRRGPSPGWRIPARASARSFRSSKGVSMLSPDETSCSLDLNHYNLVYLSIS